MHKKFLLLTVSMAINGLLVSNVTANDKTEVKNPFGDPRAQTGEVTKLNAEGVDYVNRLVKNEKGVEVIESVDLKTGDVIATIQADDETKAQLLSRPKIQGGEVGNPIRGSIEEYTQALNSDPRFDRIKKAAAGDKEMAYEEVERFISEYCEKTEKCSPYGKSEFKDEVAIAFAKIHLKTIEESNRKYAEALMELNKQLSECQEKTADLFTQEFSESCSEEIVCEGKKAEALKEIFKEYEGFEKSKIGLVRRELSAEEKLVGGVDISFMLNKPLNEKKHMNKNLDAAYPKFSMTPVLSTRNFNSNDKKMFSTKVEATNFKEIKFYNNDIPKGIMALRALKCTDEKVMKGDKVKVDESSCHIFIGNTDVTQDSKEKKSCLVAPKKEETGLFASFVNLFKSKKDSVEVNDSVRGNVKAVETEISGPKQKASKSSER